MISTNTSDGPVKLRKPVEALVMVPRSHKLSALSRKIYNVLLYISQSTLKNMQGIPPANYLFEAPLPEILKICGAEFQNDRAKRYLAEMRKADVVWDSPDSTSELQHVGFSLLSESRISKRGGGVTWIHWALPPTLYEALADPDRWATIDLLVLSRLRTYAAIVLYEICTKYRDNPSHVTCRKDPGWWIELLTASPIPIDPATGLRKPREWRKYKDEFIKGAVREVNEETDLTIELLEDREGGRTVKTVQFAVVIKRAVTFVDTTSDGTDVAPGVVQYASRLGITKTHELKSMAKSHGEEAVIAALQKLEDRQKQLNLPLVRSPSGFMRHLLSEKKEVVQEVFDAKSIPPASVILAPAPEKRTHVQTFIPQPSSKEIWLRDKNEEIVQKIMLLSETQQRDLLKAYSDSIRAKGGLITPAMERRLARLDWCSGTIKFGVIEFYGMADQGATWNVPPPDVLD